MEKNSMQITSAALSHFSTLIEKEEIPAMNLRMFVSQPETEQADVGITFCPAGEEDLTDISYPYPEYGFVLYVASDSEKALREAVIDFQSDEMGGQLSIKAPFMKGIMPDADAPLDTRVQHIIDTDINPSLAGHGGHIRLVEIIDDSIVVLQFGGGCHGCGMANVTLKQGIEKRLKEKFPQIVEIRDITDHTTGTNPYYC